MAASEEDKSFSDDETGPIRHQPHTKDAAKDKDKDRVAVLQDFFVYIGPASKPGSSLYRCLKTEVKNHVHRLFGCYGEN
jgi:hypothetical protein